MLLEQVDAAAWRQSQRADGGRHGDPVTIHLAKIFVTGLTAPFSAVNVFIRSSTGSRCSALGAAYQVGIPRMSCPDRACSSAAPVSMSLSPCEVIKSIVMSTFSLSAHSWQSLVS